MRYLLLLVIFASHGIIGPCAANAADTNDSAARRDLHVADLSDGSFLSIAAQISSADRTQVAQTSLVRHKKGAINPKFPTHWRVDLSSLNYARDARPYYALVHEDKDQIVVYATWSNSYFIVDLANGRIRANGEGDKVLYKFGNFVPLKVRLILPATGRVMTPKEVEEFDKRAKDEAIPRRNSNDECN